MSTKADPIFGASQAITIAALIGITIGRGEAMEIVSTAPKAGTVQKADTVETVDTAERGAPLAGPETAF